MPQPDQALIDAVRDALRAAGDPEKAGPMQAYMKSKMPFLGVQRPVLTKALSPLFKAHLISEVARWRATVSTLFLEAEHREERYAALALMGRARYRSWLNVDALPLCETLIVEGDWWDIVDDVATRKVSVVLAGNRADVTPRLRVWAASRNRWLRRTSILAQLKHKTETDRGLLGYAIERNLDDDDFFLRKGIGWALREYAKSAPDWVEAFVETHRDRLSSLSRREALRILRRKGHLTPPT